MAGIGGKGTGGERKQSRRERQLPQMSIRKIAFRVCVPRDGFAVSQIGVSIGVGFYTHVFNLQTDTLIVGGTPSVLIGIGFPSLPITISQVNLKANINGQYRGTPAEILDHVISSADFKKLPELISDPVAIIADRRLQHNKWTVSEHIVDVLVEMEINGKQTLVPIKIDGKGMQNGATIDALSISSVHGNRDAYDRLSYALENDDENHILTFYVNKSKATAVLQKAGHTITGWPNISNGFNHSITGSNSPVKLRITSQTESRQFKKWFRGSKVINPDGSPKVMYTHTK